jgi:hypothetical protein
VDVGDDRHIAAALAQTTHDVLQIRRSLSRRRSDAHDLAADSASSIVCAMDAFRVHRVAGDHRLDANRIRAADAHAADHHLTGDAALIREWIAQ